MQHLITIKIILNVLAIGCIIATTTTDECPSKCTCKRNPQTQNGLDWVKVRCGDAEKLTYIEDNNFLNIVNEVVQLNLSHNNLTTFSPKVQFIVLQKLDLSKNYLTALVANQFSETPKLRRLDLSGNLIKHIDVNAFSNLKHLERLKLNQNAIVSIEKGTFDNLLALKQLDIASNPLKCDCGLLWLSTWLEKHSVKLLSNPKCQTPDAFYDKPLRKIKVGGNNDIHCESPAKNREMPIVDLTPDHSQVVFEGDSLKLQCRVPSISDLETMEVKDRVEWLFIDANPHKYFNDVQVENKYLEDAGLIDSSLIINKLNRNHSGIWNCLLISQQGNHSKGITIVVISDATKYCPSTSTTNNKGSYLWPRTLVNYTVSLPCEATPHTDINDRKATHHCDGNGTWSGLNTAQCSYTSEVTKILEQFAIVNLSTLSKQGVLESAKHFKNYTSNVRVLKDVMDLVYAAKTIDNFLYFIGEQDDLSGVLIDVINNLLELNEDYLLNAQNVDDSCGKIVNAIEKIGSVTTINQSIQRTNLNLEELVVKSDTFTGLICTWTVVEHSERQTRCLTSTQGTEHADIEGFIEIPANLFKDNVVGNLLISIFANGRLFPVNSSNEVIASPIVGVLVDDAKRANVSAPIYIMLKTFIYDLTPPQPVWWNKTAQQWMSTGCQLNHEIAESYVFTCSHLGYYALLQDVTQTAYVYKGAKFRFSHPAIYIGTFILIFCLLLAIISYLFTFLTIQMPKKTKHSLLNTWLAILLLAFMYVFGIYQTEDSQLCQIVGLSLHYFTLASLLWMCVGVSTMYKRLRKNDVSIELQDDELTNDLDEPIQKPILGLYLIGWGVSLMICGISGAVNMKEYSALTHCFLNSAPALSALYVPFAILFFFIIAHFMLIKCAIYSTDANGHLSEGTQATENVDLDLLEPNFAGTAETHSIRSASTSEVEDPEHAPLVQLKAYVIFLFIYIATWIMCALATIQPFKFIPFEEDVFSIIYAILASLLGLFTLFFYCIARNDVRSQWILTSQWVRKRGFRISDANPNITQIQIQPLPPIPPSTAAPPDFVSRCSSRSSSAHTTKSSNVLKAIAADLNGGLHDTTGTKINNVNLVVLHRQQYRNVPNLIENPTHSAEMFYNPHQSTVARKFFKKQKRHMMKRNNLTTLRADLASDASSVLSHPQPKPAKNEAKKIDASNLFASNSKVNNKNIHVERLHNVQPTTATKKRRNLNILSDSCDDLQSIDNIPVEKLLMKQQHPRSKKRQNVATSSNKSSLRDVNMRSVSQQCTLEYSSETISDSILDQKSPDGKVDVSLRRENSPNIDVTSELSVVESMARIYVNPAHDLEQGSVVSASEIEELYQQIKRGPPRHSASEIYMQQHQQHSHNGGSYLSDSEINSSYVQRRNKDETTV